MKKAGQNTVEDITRGAERRSMLMAINDELVVLENRIRLLGNQVAGIRIFPNEKDDEINYNLSCSRYCLHCVRQIAERELEKSNHSANDSQQY